LQREEGEAFTKALRFGTISLLETGDDPAVTAWGPSEPNPLSLTPPITRKLMSRNAAITASRAISCPLETFPAVQKRRQCGHRRESCPSCQVPANTINESIRFSRQVAPSEQARNE
jgi:hypothetical protein